MIRSAISALWLCLLACAVVLPGWTVAAAERRLDHVFVIVLENRSFDDALFGPTPFLRRLAETQGLATWYFGVSHPSLPNYLAMISGQDFGVRDDRPSCLASDLPKDNPCHSFPGDTIVDQLEAAGLTWAVYAEDLPTAGSLVTGAPESGSHSLYAQKHNPFAYFDKIATNADRRARMKPLDALWAELAPAPVNFAFIVPNQCNDGHGLAICADTTDLARRVDAFLEKTVTAIRNANSWSDRSAIVITFDEGVRPRGLSGSPPFASCCGDKEGGHHIATILVAKCGEPRRSARALDHYSLLATIEDGFGLARLSKAKDAETMNDLVGRTCN